jgi:myo-inositol-1(or 4)-monophosphatase
VNASERLELAIDIARAVGKLQLERRDHERVIETKTSSIDLVTDVDRASDDLIFERVLRACPEDGLLSEESGHAREGTSGVRWVVDPLDGTTNYAHGVPHFAVSIGIEDASGRAAAVVFDPSKDELFDAVRGGAARLNGRGIRVSRVPTLDRALLATGFAYDVHRGGEIPNLRLFEHFIRRAQAVRRPGSAALDLAYVACGRFDGFWELHLHPWDVSAGLLLVESAGGHASDVDGSPVPRSGVRCVASNGLLHAAMLDVLRSASEAGTR